MTPHRARPLHRAAEPVHVTLRARIAPLRSQFLFPTVRLALVRATRRDPERFRIVHFSVQRDHLHLIVEATDERALSSGMRGLMIRVARYVNELLGRRGAFWADRWHGRALSSPRAVRHGLVYVLTNFRKHGQDARSSFEVRAFDGDHVDTQRREHRQDCGACVDRYSSAGWFDGWRDRCATTEPPPLDELDPRDFAARTWLLRTGWRKHGLIGTHEFPAAREGRPPPAINRLRTS